MHEATGRDNVESGSPACRSRWRGLALRSRMRPVRGVQKVSPGIALALLHSLRATDTPDEVLEDESFRISLPRRLGLNEVIDAQMRRFEEMRDRGGALTPDEYGNLLRLIGRRPDADAVFGTAGARLAEERFPARRRVRTGRRGGTAGRLGRRRLVRSMMGVAAALSPSARIVPLLAECGIDVTGGPLPGSAEDGVACGLVTAALEVCARRTAHPEARVDHARCEARGDDRCRWVTRLPGTDAV